METYLAKEALKRNSLGWAGQGQVQIVNKDFKEVFNLNHLKHLKETPQRRKLRTMAITDMKEGRKYSNFKVKECRT